MGLLVGRRGIEPKLGAFALPGGYIEYEDWRDAVCREVAEETGIKISNPAAVKLVGVESVAQMKQLVIFGEVDCISEVDLNSFSATAECQEIKIIFSPENLAFDSHNRMVVDFFKRRKTNSETSQKSG
jgi:ADP-ribose pyrophosphatase YjhB (NUDIX family)